MILVLREIETDEEKKKARITRQCTPYIMHVLIYTLSVQLFCITVYMKNDSAFYISLWRLQ